MIEPFDSNSNGSGSKEAAHEAARSASSSSGSSSKSSSRGSKSSGQGTKARATRGRSSGSASGKRSAPTRTRSSSKAASKASGKAPSKGSNGSSGGSSASSNGHRSNGSDIAKQVGISAATGTVTAAIGLAGGVLLGRTAAARKPRKVLGVKLPTQHKADLSGLSNLAKSVNDAGRQFGKLAGEVRQARQKAEEIGRALS